MDKSQVLKISASKAFSKVQVQMFPFQLQMLRCLTLQNVFSWVNIKDFSQSKMSKKRHFILYSHSQSFRTTQSSYCSWSGEAALSQSELRIMGSSSRRKPCRQNQFASFPANAHLALCCLSSHQLPNSTRGHCCDSKIVTPSWGESSSRGSHTCLPSIFVKQQ